MPSTSAEVVVVDWGAGPAEDLATRLPGLLALGIDVVVVPSDTVDVALAAAGPRAPGAGRLVRWTGDGEPAAWARDLLLGPGAPAGAVVRAGDVAALDRVVEEAGGFPTEVSEAAWRLDVDGLDPARERDVESWLTVGNGRTGTRGSIEEGSATSVPALYVAGVFGHDPGAQAGPELVRGPEWTRLRLDGGSPAAGSRRILDLRQGALFRHAGTARAVRFASLADRRLLVLDAEGDAWRAGAVPLPTGPGAGAAEVVDGGPDLVVLKGRGGGEVAYAISTVERPGRVQRVVTVDRAIDPATGLDGPADPATLWGRHRRAWRDRWRDADVVIDGDAAAAAQQALRFATYHLITAGDPESDAASIGARALTGPGYRGHVFWDTEIFVLPFFVWTHPQTARALLAYRFRTLPAARAKAARLGYEGALFAWESADTGEETTPEHVVLPNGHVLTILTGVQEHHIAADVAWAVMHYCQVTGDDAFLDEMGAEIVIETARFWASRVTADDRGRFHIRTVIGPDEYHEGVDDNAYTNVLARWNLRVAAGLCDRLPAVAARLGVGADDRRRWEGVAAGLVDNFDDTTGLFEQFHGFFDLEDVRAVDLAARPFTGELVVGVERLRRTQVVKQADVLMLGVLLPIEVGPEVQAANYRHYEPRTSHGSSLSPAMHGLVAARVGDLDAAQWYFELAGGVDLHDRMGNAADGVHIATMGGLWQAAVMGFGGVRAEGDAVSIPTSPHPGPAWPSSCNGAGPGFGWPCTATPSTSTSTARRASPWGPAGPSRSTPAGTWPAPQWRLVVDGVGMMGWAR